MLHIFQYFVVFIRFNVYVSEQKTGNCLIVVFLFFISKVTSDGVINF